MSEVMTVSFRFDKGEELARASSSFTLSGVVFGLVAAGSAVVSVLQYRSDKTNLQYDARIVDAHAAAFALNSGEPLEWDVTYERLHGGERFSGRAYRDTPHSLGDIVRIVENRNGSRHVKSANPWPFAVVAGVIAGVCLYMGIGKHVPEIFYWPPSRHVYME